MVASNQFVVLDQERLVVEQGDAMVPNGVGEPLFYAVIVVKLGTGTFFLPPQ
jgi:hypothetical protein